MFVVSHHVRDTVDAQIRAISSGYSVYEKDATIG